MAITSQVGLSWPFEVTYQMPLTDIANFLLSLKLHIRVTEYGMSILTTLYVQLRRMPCERSKHVRIVENTMERERRTGVKTESRDRRTDGRCTGSFSL